MPTVVAFTLPVLPLHRPVLPLRRPRPSSATTPSASLRPVTRRAVLQTSALALLAAAVPLPSAAAPDPALDAIAAVTQTLFVLRPVERYIREGSWDKARTSVNYCSRILALRKRMQAGADALKDDDKYLAAMEAVAEVPSLLTQLDASVYTAVFIPAEDGVSLEQREYQDVAYASLKGTQEYLRTFLNQFDGGEVEKATQVAQSAKYEIRIDSP